MFVFDREVELTAMNFNDWTGSASYLPGSGWGDNVRFHVDGQWVMNYGGTSDKPGFSMVGTMFVLTAENDETSVRIQDLDIRVLDVPEPGSWSLAGVALAGLFATRRRQHRDWSLHLFATGPR